MHNKVNDCNVAFMPQAVTDMHQQEYDLRPNTFDSSKSGVVTKNQEFNIKLEAINVELARSDSIEESIIASNKSNPRAAVISISEDHLSESRDHQKTARVPNSVSQGHVLPTWTRKTRAEGRNSIPQSKHLAGKKRVATAEGSHADFPSKRQQTLLGDNGVFFKVVEAVDQPCQSQ